MKTRNGAIANLMGDESFSMTRIVKINGASARRR
jgi:hypothetical protein